MCYTAAPMVLVGFQPFSPYLTCSHVSLPRYTRMPTMTTVFCTRYWQLN